MPENLVSTQIAVSTVPATEYTKDDLSEDKDGVITAEQQQQITSFIGGNIIADDVGIVSFAEREAINKKGYIALLEASPSTTY